MQKINYSKSILALTISCLVMSCSSTQDSAFDGNSVKIEKSFLESNELSEQVDNENVKTSNENVSQFVRVANKNSKESFKLEVDLSAGFDNHQSFLVSANELPLDEFVHYALSELLGLSYLMEPEVKSITTPVTLVLKEKVSAKRLFQLVRQILEQNNLNIAFNEGIYFVHRDERKNDKSNTAFGFGRTINDVPSVTGDIIQLVPLRFGTSPGLRQTLVELVNANISMDSVQGLLRIKGKREQVLRALSLVELMDTPQVGGKAIALLSFQYLDSVSYVEKVTELLAEEGIYSDMKGAKSASVKFVKLEHLGKVVVFASSDDVLDRVEYWTVQLDKPATGSEQSFYTYHPRFARASDLGASLAPLIGGSRLSGASGSDFGAANSNQNRSAQNSGGNSTSNTGPSVSTVEGDNLRLVVDERSNSLIFYSTGKFYQELQPIIRKLDVMPRQVMLEVVIAEVKLTGSFAKGVEYALKSGGSGNRTEEFSFKGKGGFSYSVVGLDGNININLNQTDGLVNVLSRPTILVRDGVSASISVGDDVPTVGSTTSDPINGDRETTTIQYRKTGVDLEVTPTINAQGTVIMSISQNISNVSPDGLSIDGSPSVFERKLSTEVVAGDGQSVMLGGLISENKNSNTTKMPVLGDIPVLGHLFRSDSESSDKTELVVLVTPRIIHSVEEWSRVQNSFTNGLKNINF